MMVSLEPITTVLTSITNCFAISFLPLINSDNIELFISTVLITSQTFTVGRVHIPDSPLCVYVIVC